MKTVYPKHRKDHKNNSYQKESCGNHKTNPFPDHDETSCSFARWSCVL